MLEPNKQLENQILSQKLYNVSDFVLKNKYKASDFELKIYNALDLDLKFFDRSDFEKKICINQKNHVLVPLLSENYFFAFFVLFWKARFRIEERTTCQILTKKRNNTLDFEFTNIQRSRFGNKTDSVSDFEIKISQSVRFWIKNFSCFSILNSNLSFSRSPTTCTFYTVFPRKMK